MVSLSRNRRCVRSLVTRRNQVAAADTPKPMAAAITSSRPMAQHAVGQKLEPEREQRIRQRREQAEPERHDQQRGLRLVAALQRAPHRR